MTGSNYIWLKTGYILFFYEATVALHE